MVSQRSTAVGRLAAREQNTLLRRLLWLQYHRCQPQKQPSACQPALLPASLPSVKHLQVHRDFAWVVHVILSPSLH